MKHGVNLPSSRGPFPLKTPGMLFASRRNISDVCALKKKKTKRKEKSQGPRQGRVVDREQRGWGEPEPLWIFPRPPAGEAGGVALLSKEGLKRAGVWGLLRMWVLSQDRNFSLHSDSQGIRK